MKPTPDEKPLYLMHHPQRTVWWKRLLQFFQRPKLRGNNFKKIFIATDTGSPDNDCTVYGKRNEDAEWEILDIGFNKK